jgi:hypothetical protein
VRLLKRGVRPRRRKINHFFLRIIGNLDPDSAISRTRAKPVDAILCFTKFGFKVFTDGYR